MTRPPRPSGLHVHPRYRRPVADVGGGADGGREEGSVSVELVLLTPLFLLVIALLVLCGRVMDVRLQAASLAHQAARAASTQADPRRAQAAVDAILAQPGTGCPHPVAAVDTGRWAPGGIVTVTVTCSPDLAALTLLPLRDGVPITASFTSPIDRFGGALP
jgi:Flp pilus assembly protein TadG